MPLIICRRNDGETAEQVQTKLQTVIDDAFTVVMIVYGEGPEVDTAIQVCVGRAALKCEIRRVAWVPDPGVLSQAQKKDYYRKSKTAVLIGLDDTIAKQLNLDEASVIAYVEDAFAAGGA